MQKEKFINFFINRRKELGYSQSKIASEIGLSDQAISNWERGVSFPDLIYLDDIAKLLKTNVYSLITGKNKKIDIKPEVSFNAERFSQFILKLRKSKQMTQNDLGKLLEIPGQNISKFENGVFLPSIEILEKYAKIFKVSFLNLYYGLDDEELFIETPKQSNHNKLKWLIIPVVIILVALILIIPNLITKKHIVTIILNEDTVLTYRIKDNENIKLPALPTKKGYESSWSDDNTIITEDKVYKVVYTPKTYTITYKFENEGVEDYIQQVTYGEAFKLYIPDNDNFKGYIYQDKEFNETVYKYDHNITLIGKFNNYCKVTIILDENNTEVRYVESGTNITLPVLPTKKGHNTSWSDLDTLITEDKVYKVVYTPKTYTLECILIYDGDIIGKSTESITYGEEYQLLKPTSYLYSFVGYTYNGEKIEDGIYEYDHDITVYGVFAEEKYIIKREYTYTQLRDEVGYGCQFVLDDVSIYSYLDECPFSSGEYENYKIIAWKDQKGNIYEVGKPYIYNYKEDIVLSPVFAYYGDAFEVTLKNKEATIVKYNIPKIVDLIIPDYIVIDNNKYRVTEIAGGTFQDIYFRNITLSSNITKISKNAFIYGDAENYTSYNNNGYIFYCGSLQQWFNIEFEECIVSNKAKLDMSLYISEYLVGDTFASHIILAIPEGVKVIKAYSLANIVVNEVIIPSSVDTIEKNAFMYAYAKLITNIEDVENVHPEAFKNRYT